MPPFRLTLGDLANWINRRTEGATVMITLETSVGWIREAIHQPGEAGQAAPVMFRAGTKHWWIVSIIRRWVR